MGRELREPIPSGKGGRGMCRWLLQTQPSLDGELTSGASEDAGACLGIRPLGDQYPGESQETERTLPGPYAKANGTKESGATWGSFLIVSRLRFALPRHMEDRFSKCVIGQGGHHVASS